MLTYHIPHYRDNRRHTYTYIFKNKNITYINIYILFKFPQTNNTIYIQTYKIQSIYNLNTSKPSTSIPIPQY